MATVTNKKVLLDNSSWIKMPFVVELDAFERFDSVKSMMAYVLATGFDPKASPTLDVVQQTLTTGNDGSAPEFYNKPFLADTRLGWNDAINCLWQFNRDDDIVHPVNMTDNVHGMGRVYGSVYEQNQQILWLSFGVPEFSGLVDYYSNAVNVSLARGMRNGDGSIFNSIVSVIGSTVGFAVRIPALPFIWLKKLANFKNIFSVSKYYDFKATMPLYYQAVTTILTHMAVNMHLIAGFDGDYGSGVTASGLDAALPICLATTGPDIYKILMQRAQIKVGRNDASGMGLMGMDSAELLRATNLNDEELKAKSNLTFDDKTLQFKDTPAQKIWEQQEAKDNDYKGSWLTDMWSSAFGAMSFVGFRVDKSLSSSESFSNASGESSLAQSLNSGVAGKADSGFSHMYGNLGIPGVDELKNAALTFINSAADSMGVGSLVNSIAGGAYMDIPDVYQGSSFGKSYSFDMHLAAPNGDPISIFQSIMVPLAMLMPAYLPRAAGKHAYVSPFLVRAYCKGRFSIPLGLIESVSITRGASEFGWNINQLPTQISLSFSIKDLSPAMYLAIGSATESGLVNSIDDIASQLIGIFSQNSSFQEYLLTLSGVSLNERVLFLKNLTRRAKTFTNTMRNTYLNPLYWANSIGDNGIPRLISNILPVDALPKN